MDHIDAVLYINLAHRTDRDQHIRSELTRWGIPPEKVHRMDAVARTPGALGCGLSHINALTLALSHPEWNTILVLEDDFTFHAGEIDRTIATLFTQEWDVALLSYHPEYIQYEPTRIDSIKRVRCSQTSSSYLIRRHYLPALLQNMKESTYDMERYGRRHENCIDIYWTKLQSTGTWLALYPAIGYQYDNYSDIEHRMTSYGC